jgi:hypothetical protein
LIVTAYSAGEVIREVYQDPVYTNAPMVIKKVGDYLLLVTPSSTAAKVRAGRRDGVRRRAQKKAEKEAAAREVRRLRRLKEEVVEEYRDAVELASTTLFNAIPEVAACVTCRYMYQPRTGEDGAVRDRHWLCALQATVALHRRFVRGDGWLDDPKLRAAAALFQKADAEKLVGAEEFDPVHPDDLSAVEWFRKLAVKVVRRTQAAAAAAVPSQETK